MSRPLLLVFLVLVGAAVAVLGLSRWSYATQDRDAILAPATRAHPAGTDELGRDRLVRSSAAMLIGLSGAAVAAAISIGIAAGIGLLAAFSPRWMATVLLFVCDGLLTLPWLFLLMMVRSLLPLTTSPLVTAGMTFLVLALLGWPAFARAIFRGAREIRGAEWMIHGRACGLKRRQLVWRHGMAHLRSLLWPLFLVCVPAFLMAEANLGAIGLGVGEPIPSWGAMLLEMDNSALLLNSRWVYLPMVLLVVVLLLLESFAREGTARE